MESVFQLERQKNIQFALLLILWLLVGMASKLLALAFIPVTWLVLTNKRMYLELLVGFFLILVLSDNRHYLLSFSKNLKVVYMVFLIFLLFTNSKLKPKPVDYLPFLPFLIVGLGCIAFSPVRLLAFERVVSYGMLLVIVPAFTRLLYKEYGDLFLKKYIYAASFVFLIGLILRIIDPSFVILVGRYNGILGNPNGIGIFSVLFFITFQIIKIHKPYLFSKKETAYIYVVVFLSVILCGSRNAMMCIAIFFVFRRIGKVSNVINILVVILIAFSYQYIDQLIPFVARHLDLSRYFRLKTLSDASGRFVAYAFAWHHIKQNIWMGHGFTYTDYLFKLYQAPLNMMGHEGNAHNSYLTAWLDTGLIGLVGFVGAWFFYFKRAARNSYLAYPAMYAVLFSSFFESWLMASLNPFTIQLLILLTLLNDKHFTGAVTGSNPNLYPA